MKEEENIKMTERELVIMGAMLYDPKYALALPEVDPEYLEVNKTIKIVKKGLSEGAIYDPPTAIDYLTTRLTRHGEEIPRGLSMSAWMDAYVKAQIGADNLAMVIRYIRELNDEKKKERILSKINSTLKAKIPISEVMTEVVELAQTGVDIINENDDDDGSIDTAIDEYLEWKTGESTGLHIGLPYIDRLTDYINYGEVVTYLGRPGTGKTFLMMKTVFECLKSVSTGKIAFFTIEMNRATFIERMMQMYYLEGRYSLEKKQEEGVINLDAFRNAMNRLYVFPKMYNVQEMSFILRNKKIKIAFIDYLQIISQPFGKSIFEQTTFSMRQVKDLAKREGVAVFLASQISRKGEGGWEDVTIDMARSSGEIEEHSDFMLGIWNPFLRKDEEESWRNRRRIRLIKNKRGPLGGVVATINPDTGIMHEIQKEE